jgi:hypothetical protein
VDRAGAARSGTSALHLAFDPLTVFLIVNPTERFPVGQHRRVGVPPSHFRIADFFVDLRIFGLEFAGRRELFEGGIRIPRTSL